MTFLKLSFRTNFKGFGTFIPLACETNDLFPLTLSGFFLAHVVGITLSEDSLTE